MKAARVWLGTYDTAEEAADAKEFRGLRAKLNFPDEVHQIVGSSSRTPSSRTRSSSTTLATGSSLPQPAILDSQHRSSSLPELSTWSKSSSRAPSSTDFTESTPIFAPAQYSSGYSYQPSSEPYYNQPWQDHQTAPSSFDHHQHINIGPGDVHGSYAQPVYSNSVDAYSSISAPFVPSYISEPEPHNRSTAQFGSQYSSYRDLQSSSAPELSDEQIFKQQAGEDHHNSWPSAGKSLAWL